MKRVMLFSTVVGVALVAVTPAPAQTVGIGTTKGGATAQVTAAIAKIVTTKTDIKLRPQPMGGTQQYFPIVNAGDLAFGYSNFPQYWMGLKGFGLSRRKHPNLRLVATLMRFQIGILTKNSAGIVKPADIKGHLYPVGFKASPVIGLILKSFLANAGLSEKDIRPVPVVALRQHWNLMRQGKIDVALAAVGSAIVKDLNANLRGGIRFVSMRDDAAALARTQRVVPKSWIEPIAPNPRLVGFDKPLNAITYDIIIFAYKGVADDIVYKVVKAMYENEPGLKETSPLWRSHSSRTMAKDQGPDAPYHPGAVRLYKEVGIWKR